MADQIISPQSSQNTDQIEVNPNGSSNTSVVPLGYFPQRDPRDLLYARYNALDSFLADQPELDRYIEFFLELHQKQFAENMQAIVDGALSNVHLIAKAETEHPFVPLPDREEFTKTFDATVRAERVREITRISRDSLQRGLLPDVFEEGIFTGLTTEEAQIIIRTRYNLKLLGLPQGWIAGTAENLDELKKSQNDNKTPLASVGNSWTINLLRQLFEELDAINTQANALNIPPFTHARLDALRDKMLALDAAFLREGEKLASQFSPAIASVESKSTDNPLTETSWTKAEQNELISLYDRIQLGVNPRLLAISNDLLSKLEIGPAFRELQINSAPSYRSSEEDLLRLENPAHQLAQRIFYALTLPKNDRHQELQAISQALHLELVTSNNRIKNAHQHEDTFVNRAAEIFDYTINPFSWIAYHTPDSSIAGRRDLWVPASRENLKKTNQYLDKAAEALLDSNHADCANNLLSICELCYINNERASAYEERMDSTNTRTAIALVSAAVLAYLGTTAAISRFSRLADLKAAQLQRDSPGWLAQSLRGGGSGGEFTPYQIYNRNWTSPYRPPSPRNLPVFQPHNSNTALRAAGKPFFTKPALFSPAEPYSLAIGNNYLTPVAQSISENHLAASFPYSLSPAPIRYPILPIFPHSMPNPSLPASSFAEIPDVSILELPVTQPAPQEQSCVKELQPPVISEIGEKRHQPETSYDKFIIFSPRTQEEEEKKAREHLEDFLKTVSIPFEPGEDWRDEIFKSGNVLPIFRSLQSGDIEEAKRILQQIFGEPNLFVVDQILETWQRSTHQTPTAPASSIPAITADSAGSDNSQGANHTEQNPINAETTAEPPKQSDQKFKFGNEKAEKIAKKVYERLAANPNEGAEIKWDHGKKLLTVTYKVGSHNFDEIIYDCNSSDTQTEGKSYTYVVPVMHYLPEGTIWHLIQKIQATVFYNQLIRMDLNQPSDSRNSNLHLDQVILDQLQAKYLSYLQTLTPKAKETAKEDFNRFVSQNIGSPQDTVKNRLVELINQRNVEALNFLNALTQSVDILNLSESEAVLKFVLSVWADTDPTIPMQPEAAQCLQQKASRSDSLALRREIAQILAPKISNLRLHELIEKSKQIPPDDSSEELIEQYNNNLAHLAFLGFSPELFSALLDVLASDQKLVAEFAASKLLLLCRNGDIPDNLIPDFRPCIEKAKNIALSSLTLPLTFQSLSEEERRRYDIDPFSYTSRPPLPDFNRGRIAIEILANLSSDDLFSFLKVIREKLRRGDATTVYRSAELLGIYVYEPAETIESYCLALRNNKQHPFIMLGLTSLLRDTFSKCLSHEKEGAEEFRKKIQEIVKINLSRDPSNYGLITAFLEIFDPNDMKSKQFIVNILNKCTETAQGLETIKALHNFQFFAPGATKVLLEVLSHQKTTFSSPEEKKYYIAARRRLAIILLFCPKVTEDLYPLLIKAIESCSDDSPSHSIGNDGNMLTGTNYGIPKPYESLSVERPQLKIASPGSLYNNDGASLSDHRYYVFTGSNLKSRQLTDYPQTANFDFLPSSEASSKELLLRLVAGGYLGLDGRTIVSGLPPTVQKEICDEIAKTLINKNSSPEACVAALRLIKDHSPHLNLLIDALENQADKFKKAPYLKQSYETALRLLALTIAKSGDSSVSQLKQMLDKNNIKPLLQTWLWYTLAVTISFSSEETQVELMQLFNDRLFNESLDNPIEAEKIYSVLDLFNSFLAGYQTSTEERTNDPLLIAPSRLLFRQLLLVADKIYKDEILAEGLSDISPLTDTASDNRDLLEKKEKIRKIFTLAITILNNTPITIREAEILAQFLQEVKHSDYLNDLALNKLFLSTYGQNATPAIVKALCIVYNRATSLPLEPPTIRSEERVNALNSRAERCKRYLNNSQEGLPALQKILESPPLIGIFNQEAFKGALALVGERLSECNEQECQAYLDLLYPLLNKAPTNSPEVNIALVNALGRSQHKKEEVQKRLSLFFNSRYTFALEQWETGQGPALNRSSLPDNQVLELAENIYTAYSIIKLNPDSDHSNKAIEFLVDIVRQESRAHKIIKANDSTRHQHLYPSNLRLLALTALAELKVKDPTVFDLMIDTLVEGNPEPFEQVIFNYLTAISDEAFQKLRNSNDQILQLSDCLLRFCKKCITDWDSKVNIQLRQLELYSRLAGRMGRDGAKVLPDIIRLAYKVDSSIAFLGLKELTANGQDLLQAGKLASKMLNNAIDSILVDIQRSGENGSALEIVSQLGNIDSYYYERQEEEGVFAGVTDQFTTPSSPVDSPQYSPINISLYNASFIIRLAPRSTEAKDAIKLLFQELEEEEEETENLSNRVTALKGLASIDSQTMQLVLDGENEESLSIKNLIDLAGQIILAENNPLILRMEALNCLTKLSPAENAQPKNDIFRELISQSLSKQILTDTEITLLQKALSGFPTLTAVKEDDLKIILKLADHLLELTRNRHRGFTTGNDETTKKIDQLTSECLNIADFISKKLPPINLLVFATSLEGILRKIDEPSSPLVWRTVLHYLLQNEPHGLFALPMVIPHDQIVSSIQEQKLHRTSERLSLLDYKLLSFSLPIILKDDSKKADSVLESCLTELNGKSPTKEFAALKLLSLFAKQGTEHGEKIKDALKQFLTKESDLSLKLAAACVLNLFEPNSENATTVFNECSSPQQELVPIAVLFALETLALTQEHSSVITSFINTLATESTDINIKICASCALLQRDINNNLAYSYLQTTLSPKNGSSLETFLTLKYLIRFNVSGRDIPGLVRALLQNSNANTRYYALSYLHNLALNNPEHILFKDPIKEYLVNDLKAVLQTGDLASAKLSAQLLKLLVFNDLTKHTNIVSELAIGIARPEATRDEIINFSQAIGIIAEQNDPYVIKALINASLRLADDYHGLRQVIAVLSKVIDNPSPAHFEESKAIFEDDFLTKNPTFRENLKNLIYSSNLQDSKTALYLLASLPYGLTNLQSTLLNKLSNNQNHSSIAEKINICQALGIISQGSPNPTIEAFQKLLTDRHWGSQKSLVLIIIENLLNLGAAGQIFLKDYIINSQKWGKYYVFTPNAIEKIIRQLADSGNQHAKDALDLIANAR